MNLCSLLTREHDDMFLENHVIWIPVELSSKEQDSIVPGIEIVIQLTNRKKYKGIIKMTDLKVSDNRLSGNIAIQKK
jgi:hypothetical protein